MGFIDSYKQLEKLCGDIYGDERKLSSYIDEMVNTPRGSYLVSGWDDDLKKLKHYRWIRNQIVHEPGCSEENMCESGDAQWLESFYFRIINQNDPLALYRKVINSQSVSTQKRTVERPHTYYESYDPKPANLLAGCLAHFVICAVIVILVFILSCI